MTLPLFGNPLSFSQIQTEMGGSNPISLSEYYAGGGLVPTGSVGFPSGGSATIIPSSGAISVNNFFGSSPLFIYTVSSFTSVGGLDINPTTMTAIGWNGTQRLRVKINSGVTVYDTGIVGAIRISGSFPSGIEILNEGTIVGRGGIGGNGASLDGLLFQFVNATAGNPGGSAITVGRVSTPYVGPTVIISNYGLIGGGGGGGGGGSSEGATVIGPKSVTYTYATGGGGGGGGRSSSSYPATGGSGGAATRAVTISSGSAGGNGTSSSAGNGGNGGSIPSVGLLGGNGGNGGDYGATGSTGGTGTGTKYGSEAAGGSGGAAIAGYSNASITNYGSGSYAGALLPSPIY